MIKFKEYLEEEKNGLWANIHAKRKRIKAGSGEKMRKPGSKGAPSAQDFKDASEEVVKEATEKHRVQVTVSEPDHQMVTKRKEQQQKFVRMTADDKDHAVNKAKEYYKKRGYKVHSAEHAGMVNEDTELDEAAIDAKGHKSSTGGLTQKGVDAFRRENPGSKLQTAVTTKPSKLDPDSKDAKRRKSFCARMSGVEGPMKDEKGRPTRKALALKKWNC